MLYIVAQTKEFPSWVSFNSWKEEEEAVTHSYFAQNCGEVINSTETKSTG